MSPRSEFRVVEVCTACEEPLEDCTCDICEECYKLIDDCTCDVEPEDDDPEPEDEDFAVDGHNYVWCPQFVHRIGITHRNTGECRHCVAEGLQEGICDA